MDAKTCIKKLSYVGVLEFATVDKAENNPPEFSNLAIYKARRSRPLVLRRVLLSPLRPFRQNNHKILFRTLRRARLRQIFPLKAQELHASPPSLSSDIR